MGNKVSPPTEEEKKSHHAPFLIKMFEILKEQKSERCAEMFQGMRRIIQANQPNGKIQEKEEKGLAIGLVVGEKEHKEKQHWRSEYWAGNKNVRLVSIQKYTSLYKMLNWIYYFVVHLFFEIFYSYELLIYI